MANNDQTTLPTVEKLKKQKRKRATQRAHATHFIYTFNIFSGSSDTEDLEHYRDRFQEVLQNWIVLDEAIHDLLHDEYVADAGKCE